MEEMQIAEKSIQIPADIQNLIKVYITRKKFDEGVMHQVFGKLSLSMRNSKRALQQPEVVFEEHLLLGLVPAAARTPFRECGFEIEYAHLQDKLPGEPSIPLHNCECSVKLSIKDVQATIAVKSPLLDCFGWCRNYPGIRLHLDLFDTSIDSRVELRQSQATLTVC
jgi:hypothetical protein